MAEPEGERFAHGLRQTWELELVISGAVAFALLQLPSVVDQAYDRFDAHLAGNLREGLFVVHYYTKLALYTMIATFLVHLVARAYWVGLVGLEAVFPHGVRWEKVSAGPIAKRYYEQRLPTLKNLIEKTDNFCSAIFSFSFMIIFIFVLSLLWAGLLGLLAFGISWLFFSGERVGAIFRALGLLLLLPLVVIGPLDKSLGGRLDPASRPARALRALTAFYYRALCMDLYAPIMMVQFSNIRKQAIRSILAAALVGVIGAFVLSDLARAGLLSLDSDVYMPGDGGAMTVSPDYYEDQRPDDKVFRMLPSIPSDVIDGPYVKLFIPYYPRRHNPLIAQRCPGVKPLREPGLRFDVGNRGAAPIEATRAVLRCLADFHRVTLDGRPIPNLEFQFATHPKTALRGIVAYIPTAGLAPGSHLLSIEAAPPAEPRKGERSPEPYLIRFWV